MNKNKQIKKKQNKKTLKSIVPDTSILIDGKLSEMIEKKKLNNVRIIIPKMVLDELQSQASRGKEIGFEGLSEIKKLRELSKKRNISVEHTGRRPTLEEIKLAKKGRIDALIKDTAEEFDAVLYTEDMVQAESARAEGLNVVHIRRVEEEKLLFEKYFTKDTMSIHLKEGARPLAKRGKPGKFVLVEVDKKIIEREELEEISKNIYNVTRHRDDAIVEISMYGASVIQIGDYRIAIAKPPFSKGMEITVVRPIIKLTLKDYKPSEKLMQRLREKVEGVLVAGPPGSGKSTFVQSLAEFLFKQGKIVKTIESPRDLHVSPEITQYAHLNGDVYNTADILLLVRPDYTIFDEIRKGHDFSAFSDMRLAGIGMVGVVHATDPIDAVQRFIGRTDLGMIPHILDTIIYIKGGQIKKIYSISMVVRVPTGMVEQDLARPVVEIKDFETGKLEYEIYTYGEENIVVPVKKEKERGLEKLAKSKIYDEIKKFDKEAKIEFISPQKVTVKVNNKVIPRLIGKSGKTIDKIEDKLGLSIDVQPKVKSLGKEIKFDTGETGAYIILNFNSGHKGENANIYIENEYLFTATVGKEGQIKIAKDSDLGKKLISALTQKKKIKVFI